MARLTVKLKAKQMDWLMVKLMAKQTDWQMERLKRLVTLRG